MTQLVLIISSSNLEIFGLSNSYLDACVSYVSFDRCHGLKMNILFKKPLQLRSTLAKEKPKL
jgi:hypothetical protein